MKMVSSEMNMTQWVIGTNNFHQKNEHAIPLRCVRQPKEYQNQITGELLDRPHL